MRVKCGVGCASVDLARIDLGRVALARVDLVNVGARRVCLTVVGMASVDLGRPGARIRLRIVARRRVRTGRAVGTIGDGVGLVSSRAATRGNQDREQDRNTSVTHVLPWDAMANVDLSI
jgi:hypothetical protein